MMANLTDRSSRVYENRSVQQRARQHQNQNSVSSERHHLPLPPPFRPLKHRLIHQHHRRCPFLPFRQHPPCPQHHSLSPLARTPISPSPPFPLQPRNPRLCSFETSTIASSIFCRHLEKAERRRSSFRPCIYRV